MKFTAHISTAALAAAFTLGALAQTRSSTPEPQNRSVVTPEAAQDAARTTRSTQQTDFLLEALRSSLAEARAGELAAQQSYDQRVRDYGMRLRDDHTAHASEIERLLKPGGVALPSEPSGESLSHLAALTKLTGKEFDAAFVQLMIWTHTEAIEKYGAQTHANPDRSLHDFAQRSLPMLREHLRIAESLR